ncbi:ABC transporter ATP-binding protein/permease [Bifidobacterium leontopitheci]|nr:ATP-binding cassette domain-containing protein [Bifidobacterium leontopitheci]
MIDKRLFRLAPGIGRLTAGKVLMLWVGLLTSVAFVVTLVGLLRTLLATASGMSGTTAASTPLIPRLTVPQSLAALAVIALVRYLTTLGANRLGFEAAERVKLSLRERLYRKMLALGPAYSNRVKTADVVQSSGEGIEQIQSFFELFLPQLFYSVLAPLTLFVVLLPVNWPAALVLLVCAPLIVVIVGLVAMRAARVFKKYWGKYTDLGAAFLDDVQGLETLKAFDADERAARSMDAKAEEFRVMTMRVLQIQLRSLTAMDVVAYGGAAAGIGMAVWQCLAGSLDLAGGLVIVLLSADFFIPLRQLGSFFHVAMNGMTSTKRIFALLDAPEPQYGDVDLDVATDGRGGRLTVRFDHVGYAYEPQPGNATAGAATTDALPTDAASAGTPTNGTTEAGETTTEATASTVITTAETATAGTATAETTTASPPTAQSDGTAVKTAAPALADVSFVARPGSLTAIVGVSGSGKSTAAAVLAGMVTGYTGSVTLSRADDDGDNVTSGGTVDGRVTGTISNDTAGDRVVVNRAVELRDLSGECLSRTVTLVGARAHLFAGTLRDNLLMASPDADDEQLWSALRDARIDDFVHDQPGGLDMTIEPDAANLSGGQRQRIAIARALLHDSAVYVFDEATSSVDAESEERILSTIRELAADHTVLMITHRMANAVGAGNIVVFERGSVVETGSHNELMAADGTYARLFRAQQTIEQVGRATEADGPAGRDAARSAESAQAASTMQATQTAQAQTTQASTVQARINTANDAQHGQSAKDDAQTVHVADAGHAAVAEGAPSAHAAHADSAQSASPAPSDHGPRGTIRLIWRLLHVAAPLSRFMVAACVAGSIGHLAATFLPVFGVMALLALVGTPVWGMGVSASVTAMAVCALIRGLMRYVEQFMNHNVAFRLLALFRHRAFAALRRLAPAKLDSKGKGDLIALVTTDVEMLEIFFAHTISPTVIALVTTVAYAAALCTLNPWMALLLIAAHLTVGVTLPLLFARSVRGIGPALRRESAALDDRVLDGMRGIGEIIRFGAGEVRVADIVTRTRGLWARRARLNRVNGRFAGLGGVLVLVFTAAAAFLAAAVSGATLSGGVASVAVASVAVAGVAVAGVAVAGPSAALVAAVVLVSGSFGPTLALSALPANLTNTFAAARRLFALMDEAPAVVEHGTATPEYTGMTLDRVTFAYPEAMADGSAVGINSPDDGTVLSGAGTVLMNDDAARAGVGTMHDAATTPADTGSAGSAAAATDAESVDSATAAGPAPVLADLSLDVPRTGILGVQGPSGRGKSTVLKLLMRYWDPQSGRVMIADTPLPDVDAQYRRRVQTLMSQETALFDGTIRDNLMIALPQSDGTDGTATVTTDQQALTPPPTEAVSRIRTSATLTPPPAGAVSEADWGWSSRQQRRNSSEHDLDARLREACRKASVLDLIDSLPQGLDTPVGELGDRLSEGERQRIGLARVFLREADLVLFDEPTSRLDALNEAVILQSILALTQDGNTAAVLVSHRESAMRIADRVVAL